MKKQILHEITALPPLPTSVIELDQYKNTDCIDVEKLMEIIKKDPLIVANILKVSNSSMFGFRSRVETLSRAINLLGIKFTISIAIGSAIQNTMKSNLLAYAVSNEDFIYTSSLATNIINTWVSNIDFDLKNELLIPAFLQEVGKFIISEVIQKEKRTEEFLSELNETNNISFCEEKYMGFTCARITANVFKRWNLSPNIILPIAYAEDLETCPEAFKQKAQILQIIKILCDIRDPLSDKNVERALKKVVLYKLDIEQFLNAIDVIKEVIRQNS
jgi:HD-like signal output (HDOD) protein